ncbi:N-acetylmuramoyl-L-alanine amidase [Brumicola pallidula]|uniref:N-acetylmuramoyl-L-alanine amidase n=1 Tax=Brumicola pallidula DSM 14239 = ACAM 615 TaxID=1121922 RepID=K6Z2R6_9ALTE|nr:N-acetylmuramoyl-L-alanine amidase [Glaciecola pallidula]GAC30521.1 N-acetylmuramoyl-L-alanine amidase [Glaciecola pallidula DSM 14239 = ACAM 615]
MNKNVVAYKVVSSILALFVSLTAYAQAQSNITDIRISPSNDNTRIVVDISQQTSFSYFNLKSPRRLVVDLKDTDRKFNFSKVENSSDLIKKIRYSTPKLASDMRMVIELNKDINAQLFSLEPNADFGYRIVIDLKDPNPAPVVTSTAAPKRDKDIIIVIDAGHGGVDPGSIGPKGTYEKNITLSISKMLEKRINEEPGLRAVMTRHGDYYISPNDRPDFATKENADLLVSIHADAFTTPQPRGGSVWVLSKGRADSELGRLLERTERNSELLGSAADVIGDRDTERYFAETIFNMSMDLSRASSYDISNKVIKEMRKVTRMHKKVPQSASLAVLTAPETPSILVEVGFISNPQEEKNLNWRAYRQQLADSLFKSIQLFFRNAPPEGTLWAQERDSQPRKHRVKSGESLSLLAQRYNVDLHSLREVNNIKGDLVRIGQTLTIPEN